VVEALRLVAGWLFFIGALCGWYTASAMMLEAVFHRPVLSLGRPRTTAWPLTRIDRGGEPGSVLGQATAARRG
jgi:hypothetical protein